LRRAMDRMIEDGENVTEPVQREFALPVNVTAEEEAFTLQALVPGLEAEDLNIEILNNTVSIRGEFKNDADENTRYLRHELPAGPFNRVLTLPVSVDAAKAEANMKNGFLTLRLPKT